MAMYDPCSYPGIQCKFYYNLNLTEQTGQKDENTCNSLNKSVSKIQLNIINVSFMIFRTGSVLIVGKCDEEILKFIYEFLKKILKEEYLQIGQQNINIALKDKTKKIRRKTITVDIASLSTATLN